MEQIWEAGLDSEVADALFGFLDSPPFLPPFDSESTILSFPPPPPSDISSSLLHSSSDLDIHELPPPLFEPIPFFYPSLEPTLFAEFEAPQAPTMAMVAPPGSGLSAQSVAFEAPHAPTMAMVAPAGSVWSAQSVAFEAPDASTMAMVAPAGSGWSAQSVAFEAPQEPTMAMVAPAGSGWSVQSVEFEAPQAPTMAMFAPARSGWSAQSVTFEAPEAPTMTMVAPAGSGLSVQSVAARERRKRIGEKTLQLGWLIPGGNRMNTAQMLQAAFKYIKFLQAQLHVLHLMDSIQACKSAGEEHLQVLLASPIIQEKLSAEGMCIAPKEVVDEFVTDPQLKSRPLISSSK